MESTHIIVYCYCCCYYYYYYYRRPYCSKGKLLQIMQTNASKLLAPTILYSCSWDLLESIFLHLVVHFSLIQNEIRQGEEANILPAQKYVFTLGKLPFQNTAKSRHPGRDLPGLLCSLQLLPLLCCWCSEHWSILESSLTNKWLKASSSVLTLLSSVVK